MREPAAYALDEPLDRLGGLGDHGLERLLVTFRDGVLDAVAEVLVEEADGDGLERLGHRADLREDIDAAGVFVDHAADATHLAFDAAETFGVVILGGG